ALGEVSESGDHLRLCHEWTAPGISPTPEGFDLKQFGVIRQVLGAGRPWIWHRGEPLPSMAQPLDRVFLGAPVIRAAAIIPFDVAGRPRHALMMHQGEDPHGLRGEVAQRLHLLARMLGDLLSRARLDAERRAHAQRLESMVAQIPTCLCLVDADGRPQHLNRAGQRLLGLTPQTVEPALAAFELSTLAAAAGFPPGMDLLGGDAAQLAVEAPLARLQEALGLPPDGGEGRIVSTRFLCIEQPDGSREGALRFEEITAQRQLEARIRRAQKLEAIGELAGGLAHEFNNELGVIQLGLGQALQALRQGRPVDAQDLESALAAARRSGDTTRHLLGFSRRAELRPRVVDLGRLVARFESTLRRWLPERIVLAVHPVAALADVDPGLIEQALLNLLSNARDAIEGPGRIDIAVGVDGAQVHLAVRDDGPGMPAEVQARAFEPFFTTKPVG
ncbi:MAG: hypothetical protein KC613_16130, partial [Myxococcales bacterium]|nr:hypothetical protein [Myxococcales bacterium]